MQLTKYNIYKDGKVYSSSTINNESNSAASSVTSTDRVLWGNSDTGGDLSRSMKVEGNIYLRASTYDETDDTPDSRADGSDTPSEPEFPYEDDDESGSLYADGTIEGNEVYGHSLFVDYPASSKTKTNVLDIFKGHDNRITKNKNDITNLDSRVTTNTADISNLKTRVSTAETNITTIQSNITTINNNITTINGNITNIKNDITNIESGVTDLATEIDDIKTRIKALESNEGNLSKSDIEQLIYDGTHFPIATPVILFSGELYSNNNDGNLTWQQFYTMNSMKHGFVKDVVIDYISKTDNIPGLKISFNNTDGWDVRVSSVSAMVLETTDFNNVTSAAGGNPRSRGYWCTGGISGSAAYISVWRTQDDNNDSVRYDCMPYRVKKLSVTIFGYAYKDWNWEGWKTE